MIGKNLKHPSVIEKYNIFSRMASADNQEYTE